MGDLFHGRLPIDPGDPRQPGGRPAVYAGRGAPGLPASPYANRHVPGRRPCRHCRRDGDDQVVHDRAGAVLAYALDLAEQPASDRSGTRRAAWPRCGLLVPARRPCAMSTS